MEDQNLLGQLETAVKDLGIELRWDEGEFTGGVCCFRDRKILLVNRSLPTFAKIKVLCRELSNADLSMIFLLPAVRERIERAGR